jgi:hypothetical protein
MLQSMAFKPGDPQQEQADGKTDRTYPRVNITKQLLKTGTIGTTLYGLYLAYMSRVRASIEGDWALAGKIQGSALEKHYLSFLMDPSQQEPLRLKLLHILESDYGISHSVRLDSLPRDAIAWSSYHKLIKNAISLLGSTSEQRADSLSFVKRCVELFCQQLGRTRNGKQAHENITEINTYIETGLKTCMDYQLQCAVASEYETLKDRHQRSHNSALYFQILQKCFAAGVMNDTNMVREYADKPLDSKDPVAHVILVIRNAYQRAENFQE